MVSQDTFLTELYVSVDDFCKLRLKEEDKLGRPRSLSRSEVVTLAIFGQGRRFGSEREFYRYAQQYLCRAFPSLPNRSQFNRLMRRHQPVIEAFGLYLVEVMDAQAVAYEAMDCVGVAVRNVKRRGNGWLTGMTAIGISNRIGWYEGFKLLLSVTPIGVITGSGFASANVREQPMTDVFLEARRFPDPRLTSVGKPAHGSYIVDKGFWGRPNRERWRNYFQAVVIGLPHTPSVAAQVPKPFRRWLASLRQIVETVNNKLLDSFRLDRERPHDLVGFQARLAAKIALHNFCIRLNQLLGRPPLAFADLLDP